MILKKIFKNLLLKVIKERKIYKNKKVPYLLTI